MRVGNDPETTVLDTIERVACFCEGIGVDYPAELDRGPQRLARLLEEAAARI